MTWRVAQALLNLRDEADHEFPKRDHASDGTIGNTAHQKKGDQSDHNPFIKDGKGVGVVRAIDVDAGPGLNPGKGKDTVGTTVAEAARLAGKNGHPALKGGGYVIFQGKIASPKSEPPWSWRDFPGDPHTSHVHISVGKAPEAYDNGRAWGVRTTPRKPEDRWRAEGCPGHALPRAQGRLEGRSREARPAVPARLGAREDAAVLRHLRGQDRGRGEGVPAQARAEPGRQGRAEHVGADPRRPRDLTQSSAPGLARTGTMTRPPSGQSISLC